MYKQPTNKHRVLAMKDKFENKISNNTSQNNVITHSQVKSNNNIQKVILNNNNTTTECTNTNIVSYLPKQMNGLPKRIIKRSEAFRRDKNYSDSIPAFQRNFALRTSYRTKNIDDKIKLFDNSVGKSIQRSGSFSDLYSTPRRKDNFSNDDRSISIGVDYKKDLQIGKCDNRTQDSVIEFLANKAEDFRNASKLSNCETEVSINHLESHLVLQSLHETFKDALKKPLPIGPAPSKPPRIFLYTPNNKLIENYDIKTLQTLEKPPILKKESRINRGTSKFVKGDPKYMLDKLETALKNNKMKFKRQERIDSNFTSEDENESDSSKFNKKNLKSRTIEEPNVKFNLALEDKSDNIDSTCVTRVSTFKPEETQKKKKLEPIYAEPFHHNKTECEEENEKSCTQRNSLYYLSTPVVLVHKEETLNFKD